MILNVDVYFIIIIDDDVVKIIKKAKEHSYASWEEEKNRGIFWEVYFNY